MAVSSISRAMPSPILSLYSGRYFMHSATSTLRIAAPSSIRRTRPRAMTDAKRVVKKSSS